MNNWVVYLIQCADNTYYCGCTNNLTKRLELHNKGRGAKYTRGRTPVQLISYKGNLTKSQAHQLEYQVKKVPKSMKLLYLNNFYQK